MIFQKLIPIVLFILPMISISQTCIIAVRTADSIFVGSDTKMVSEQGATSVCKIAKDGDRYWAMTGFAFEYVAGIVNEAFSKEKTLLGAAEYAKNRISEQIPGKLKDLISSPNLWLGIHMKELQNIHLIFFGFENGIPKFYVTHNHFDVFFDGTDHNFDSLNTTMSDPIGENNPITDDKIALGHYNAIIDDIRQHWPQGQEVSIIYSLITKQSLATPENVAKPITVLAVTKNGFTWMGDTFPCF